MKNPNIQNVQRRQVGVTLVEVLITMVVILFGLVGLSQLFLKASRMSEEAYERHRALVMANQMAESMRSMVRLKETGGAGGTSCPASMAMSSDGMLTNDELMDCFVSLSRPGGRASGSLGLLRGEAMSALDTLSTTKNLSGGGLNCTSATSTCNMREMVLWMLNSWTEILAGYSQTATPPTGGTAVYSAKGFTARGCIDKISDSTYRVRVFWRSDDPIDSDADENYCGVANNDLLRYTFVDVSLSSLNK